MVYITNDLLFNILNYNYNVNILLNKEYHVFLKQIRNNFKDTPLTLKYQLLKCRQKMGDQNVNINSLYKRSPSIKVMEEEIYQLYGDLPLGKIVDNNIDISPELKEKLIPTSERFVYPYYLWNYYPNIYILIYWEIFKIKALNMNRAVIYSQIF